MRIGMQTIALDFDGDLTDGRLWGDQDGRTFVRCTRKDWIGSKHPHRS
jgi:3-deoxy-D-manno-octulosonate 8-phosphate phosphatase KdsC-like HAD superfamily phosphatase